MTEKRKGRFRAAFLPLPRLVSPRIRVYRRLNASFSKPEKEVIRSEACKKRLQHLFCGAIEHAFPPLARLGRGIRQDKYSILHINMLQLNCYRTLRMAGAGYFCQEQDKKGHPRTDGLFCARKISSTIVQTLRLAL